MGRHARRAIPRRVAADTRPRREDFGSYVEYSRAIFEWGVANRDPDAMFPVPTTPEDQADFDVWCRNDWLAQHGLPSLSPDAEAEMRAAAFMEWSNENG